MFKYFCLFVLFLFVPNIVLAQEDVPIREFLRVSKDFCTGAQPKLENLQKLKDEGVKAIINLRVPTEHRAAEEEEMAKKLGLKYFNIPVVFGDPKEEQVTEFLKITDDPANRPAFIHCARAIRVGAFWMIRRVLRDGWTIEDAEKEAEKVGLRESPHLTEFAKKYIEKYRNKKQTKQFNETKTHKVCERLALHSIASCAPICSSNATTKYDINDKTV